jgi:hypothetical protein
MTRDILIVIALDIEVLVLAVGYSLLADHWWFARTSPQFAVFWALLVLASTAVAGTVIRRLPVGIIGMTVLWAVLTGLDLATSSASFSGVASSALICLSVQMGVFIAAWWFAGQIGANPH